VFVFYEQIKMIKIWWW